MADSLKVACECGAKAGEPCRAIRRGRVTEVPAHAERRRAAKNAAFSAELYRLDALEALREIAQSPLAG